MDLKVSHFKEIKKPTDSMLSFYENMFKRNQSKFIRRSKLDVSHLGCEFNYADKKMKMKILGAMDANLMVAENVEDGKCYIIHGDSVTNSILKK
jgi:hypothetical protein